MNANDFFKSYLKDFAGTLIIINFFVLPVYGAGLQEVKPLQSDQRNLCVMNLLKNPPVQLSPQDRVLINRQFVPFSSSQVIHSVQYWLGNFIFGPIQHSSISDLAEEIYKHKGVYNLVFKSLRGTFSDVGIFDSLEGHPHVIRISANETKTFYIHVMPSRFDSFVIYLVNKTPFGDILSYIDDPSTTGALISWFRRHFEELEFSTFTFVDENPITLDAIFRKIHKEVPLPEHKQASKSFTNEDDEDHWLDIETLSEVYEVSEETTLTFTIQLATFQNRLQALKSLDVKRIVDAFKFYSDTEMSEGKYLQDDNVRNATLFTVFLDAEPDDMLGSLKHFKLFERSSYRSFLRKALLLQLVLAEVRSLYAPNTEKLNVREILGRTEDIYGRIEKEKKYNSDGSLNKKMPTDEDLQNAYLTAMLLSENVISKNAIDNALLDIQVIRESSSVNSTEEYQEMYVEGAIVTNTTSSTRKYEESYVSKLLLRSSVWDIPADQLLNAFSRIFESVGNLEVTLILLKGIKLGYIPNYIVNIFQSAGEFFHREEPDPKTIADLVVLGLLADLYPEQIMTIYREAVARLEDQNVFHTVTIDFINSVINLRAKPYEDLILSDTGVMKAVRYDENGNTEVVPTLHAKDYLMLQVVDWLDDL